MRVRNTIALTVMDINVDIPRKSEYIDANKVRNLPNHKM